MKSHHSQDIEDLEEGHILNPVKVSYANRAISGQFGIPFHGFAVVSGTPRTLSIPHSAMPKKPIVLKTHHSKVLYLGASYVLAPFLITEKLVAAVLEKQFYSRMTKKMIRIMKNEQFPTVEHFFQRWFMQSAKAYFKTVTPEEREVLYLWASDPLHYRGLARQGKFREVKLLEKLSSLLQEASALIHLNMELNSAYGAILPVAPNTRFCMNDREAFDRNECSVQDYPSINATAVYELFQQQLIFKHYLEEKLKVSYSVDLDTKLQPAANTKRILKRLVRFADLPPKDFFLANCNKATATFLQEADLLSHKASTADAENKSDLTYVSGASFCAIGAGQRMFFWNSRLHTAVINLFVNREFKQDDADIKQRIESLLANPQLLQELADNKQYMLQIFATWPLAQEKQALQQILDEHSPLGVVFLARKSMSLPLRDPHLSRGTLKIAADRLEELSKIQNSHESKKMSPTPSLLF